MTEDIGPMYPELSEEGKQAAIALIEKFKAAMQQVAYNIIGQFYGDILPWIESDAWCNMRRQIKLAMCGYKDTAQPKSEYEDIRRSLVRDYKDELVNDTISDLQAEIELLKAALRKEQERCHR